MLSWANYSCCIYLNLAGLIKNERKNENDSYQSRLVNWHYHGNNLCMVTGSLQK